MKTKLLLLVFLVSLSTYSQNSNIPSLVPTNGLIAYYPFSANANDASGNGNNGITTDATLTSDRFGNSNNAYSFNGTSSTIEANVKNYPLKGESRTITGWFKAASPVASKEFNFCLLNYGNISDPNYWFKISFYSKGYLDVQFDSKTFQSQENYFNNTWTFFALTFDDASNTYSLYINNVYKMGGSADLYTNGFGNLFRIGRNKLNNYFEGAIDDIGIWNRVLTADEITSLYNFKNNANLYTIIPDGNFEKKLISLGIDSGLVDGKVLKENIASLTSLDVSSSHIIDLTGIHYFAALKTLKCNNNQLTALDLSQNVALNSLDCSYNYGLKVFDLSKNTALTTLECIGNHLTTLNLSQNVALNSLNCSSNGLKSLDVSANSSLASLRCSTNQLLTLDVSKNTAIKILNCDENQLSLLDISLNIVLDSLNCSGNQLKDLDLSKNENLKKLNCSVNKLQNLNLKNGNNQQLVSTYSTLSFGGNPDLSCIQVDDKTYSDSNWADFKDAAASYNTACISYTLIPDVNFENKLIALGIDTDGLNGKITISNIANITSLDLSNFGISNLSGIEQFTSLETLICSGNSLSTINVFNNTALKYLDCSNNPLITLDVSKNKLLTELYCDGVVTITNKNSTIKNTTAAQLIVLDLSNNLFLTKLSCSDNQLVSLDVSKNTFLTDINCSNNSLQNLNLSNGNNTKMLNVNFKSNSSLSCINVDDPAFSNTNWTEAKDATAIYSKTACTLGIEDVVFDKLALYPNPVKGQLHIDNIVLEKVTVYDSLGKLIKTTKFINGPNTNSIDLAGLAKGIYYVYLESEGANTVKKIAVE
ncbi:T9SS type A sorting domain-containing protein [Flavobacterium sp. XS2P39]|uniref:T9SS type A sorting domain-containing protein n=1 Tax=Flavobacterium sp. XS2P39 TaxID=3401725 RepID=UPI003AB0462C